MWVLSADNELVNLDRIDHIKLVDMGNDSFAVKAIRYLDNDVEFFVLAKTKGERRGKWLVERIQYALAEGIQTNKKQVIEMPYLLNWLEKEAAEWDPQPTLETQATPSETKSGAT